MIRVHAPSALIRERLFDVRKRLSRFASGFSGHFASLLLSKKGLLPKGILIFFSENTPDFEKLKLDFFPVKKSFSQIFQNTANFFYLNFISVNFHKNQRNFFGREVAHYDFPGKFYYFGTNYERSFKRFAEHFLIGR